MRAPALAVLCALAGCTSADGEVGIVGPGGNFECPPPSIVFLNRNGGTYVKGVSNSFLNQASALLLGSSTVVPPFDGTDAEWQATFECFRDLVSPYNIAVTDEDPGDVDHLEIVTSGDELGHEIGADDVILIDRSCPLNPREVGFTFDPANPPCTIDGVVLHHCYAAGQALGFMVGLNSPGFGECGGHYPDDEFSCGPGGDFPFLCGECSDHTSQSSHDKLIEVFGPACEP